MPRRSPRELEHELDKLRDDDTPTPTDLDVTVEWGDADPSSRPTGMVWDPDEGLITYDLWDAQRETFEALEDDEADADLVAFLAGYGSGKSIFGARWLLAQALEHPGSRFLALGIDYQKARDSTFRVLFGQLPGDRTTTITSSFNGPEHSPIVEDYNRQEHRLTLANDSVIVLGSADRWNRYAGDEYGAVWLDEPSHYGSELHDLLEMIGGRLRGVDGPKKQLWTLTGNGYNAAWEILEKREDDEGDPIGLDIELIRAETMDNPYLDEADVERFRRQYEGTAREEQALRGGFAAAQGLVYSNFSRDVHVVEHVEALELAGSWRMYGYDAGWRDPRVLLEIAKTPYDQLVVVDEFHEGESHVEDAIRWLKENHKDRGVVYCEHEPAEIEKFERAGFKAEKAEKSIDAGIADVRERFELDADDRPGLLISEKCEHLIRELQGYKEDQVGASGADDHCVDALRYAVHTNNANPPTKHVARRGTPDEIAKQRQDSSSAADEDADRRGAHRRVVRRRSPGGPSNAGNVGTESAIQKKRKAREKREERKRKYWEKDR